MYPFDYREYLFFKENTLLEPLSLSDIKNKNWKPEHIRAGGKFRDFISGGLLPFSLEEKDVLHLLNNVLEKIIFKDIPLVTELKMNELELIKKVIRFVAKSQIDGISFSTLSNNLKITKYKAEQYVKLLEQAFLFNVVYPEGTNVLKEPKILLNLPYRLLFKEFDEVIGQLREEFFVECMRTKGKEIHYLKTKKGKKTPDYLVSDNGIKYVIEVGGKGKGISQFKGIDLEKSIIFVDANIVNGIKRPLFLAGFVN